MEEERTQLQAAFALLNTRAFAREFYIKNEGTLYSKIRGADTNRRGKPQVFDEAEKESIRRGLVQTAYRLLEAATNI